MKLAAIFITLTIALFARDNFIYESYKPGEVEAKISGLQKDIGLIKKQLMIIQKNQQQIKEKEIIKTKQIIVDNDTKNAIKDLKVVVWNLQKKINNVKEGTVPAISGNTDLTEINKELFTKVTKLEKRIDTLKTPKPENMAHDSMRIDILDDKIRDLERAIAMIDSNGGGVASIPNPIGLNFKDKVTQYFLLIVGAVFLLLFAMAAIAMGRSKDALIAVKKLSTVKRS